MKLQLCGAGTLAREVLVLLQVTNARVTYPTQPQNHAGGGARATRARPVRLRQL